MLLQRRLCRADGCSTWHPRPSEPPWHLMQPYKTVCANRKSFVCTVDADMRVVRTAVGSGMNGHLPDGRLGHRPQ